MNSTFGPLQKWGDYRLTIGAGIQQGRALHLQLNRAHCPGETGQYQTRSQSSDQAYAADPCRNGSEHENRPLYVGSVSSTDQPANHNRVVIGPMEGTDQSGGANVPGQCGVEAAELRQVVRVWIVNQNPAIHGGALDRCVNLQQGVVAADPTGVKIGSDDHASGCAGIDPAGFGGIPFHIVNDEHTIVCCRAGSSRRYRISDTGALITGDAHHLLRGAS